MTAAFGHDTLHSRYRFEGDLELKTPLRLSSGRADDRTDAPFMRDRAGVPYIPGSSLRGGIRAELERILAAVGPAAAGVSGCALFTTEGCDTKVEQFHKQRQVEEMGPVDFRAVDRKMMQFVEDSLCDVCKLFGVSLFASRLQIRDAYPETKAIAASYSAIRDGVGIDRDTGTAREGVKFNYEVIEPGPVFGFWMQVENLTDADRALIKVIIALLRDGLHLGGKQAAGLGLVKLKEAPEVTGFENPKAMWDDLLVGDDPHKPLRWGGP